MFTNSRVACPVGGCKYYALYRMGGDGSEYPEVLRAEHPAHPAVSASPRNVKPKTLDLERQLGYDRELNF